MRVSLTVLKRIARKNGITRCAGRGAPCRPRGGWYAPAPPPGVPGARCPPPLGPAGAPGPLCYACLEAACLCRQPSTPVFNPGSCTRSWILRRRMWASRPRVLLSPPCLCHP